MLPPVTGSQYAGIKLVASEMGMPGADYEVVKDTYGNTSQV